VRKEDERKVYKARIKERERKKERKKEKTGKLEKQGNKRYIKQVNRKQETKRYAGEGEKM
jgi:hypothetical protein